MSRYQLRRSYSKSIPGVNDLLPSELGYSYQSNKLYMKNEVTNQIDCIGGKEIVDIVLALNRLPSIQAAIRELIDNQSVVNGSLLDYVTDPENETITIVSFIYSGVPRNIGMTFNTTLGEMLILSNGQYTFTLNDNARNLQAGETDSVAFSYTVMDASGGRRSQTFTLNITGTNQGPVTRPDSQTISAGTTASGNVLINDIEYENDSMTLTGFTGTGLSGNQPLNQIVNVPNYGTIRFSTNGNYEFIPQDINVTGALSFTYYSTDGVNNSSGVLNISVAPPPPTNADMLAFYAKYKQQPIIERPAPNPVTGRPLPDRTKVYTAQDYPGWNYSHLLPNQIGRPANAYDFEIGPGKAYSDIDKIPWEFLLPGDRVFIYWRPTPYNKTIVINCSGTADAWIEIIGVRDPVTGQMPVIDGDDAICAKGEHTDIYDGAALITFGHMTTGVYGMVTGAKPRFIHVTGFELKNAHPSLSRINKYGNPGAWGEFGSAFYGIGFDNVCIQGNEMHNCGLGIFVNSLLAERFQSRNLHVCNNYIYNCSAVASYGTHSAYIEGINTLYEHNYFKAVVAGSFGDTIKDRSSGVVFRYNYIENSANALSLRDPSSENGNQNGWYEALAIDSFGELTIKSAFVYSNTFVNYRPAPESIVCIGDGVLAQHREGTLYFYSNIVLTLADATSGFTGIYYDPYRVPIFGLPSTRSPITVNARNNLFYSSKVTSSERNPPYGIFFWQGLADFQSNWITSFTNTAYDTNYAATLAKGPQFNGSGLGGLTASTDSPGFVGLNIGDYGLLQSSPFYSLNAPVHPFAVQRGLVPEAESIKYPFGVIPKPTIINPVNITGNRPVGSVLTLTNYSFTPLPSSYIFKWYRNGVLINNESNQTYITKIEDVGTSITGSVTAVNSSGLSAEAVSVSGISVTTSTTPLIVINPQIVGPEQVTFEHSVTFGTWTNNPTTYEYQIYLNGVALPEATQNVFYPDETDINKTLQWMVTARAANGEYSSAMSNMIVLKEVNYDPEVNGKFNFIAANNTTLLALDAKWNGINHLDYGNTTTHFTCQNDLLVCTSLYGNFNRPRVWYVNSQSDNVSVEASISFSNGTINNNAMVGIQIGLRQTTGQHYAFGVCSNGVFVGRNGTRVSGRTDMTITSPAILKVIPNNNVFDIYVNGVLEHTYTDTTPLTGGYPGIISMKDGNPETEAGMDYWTDNP